VKVLLIRFSSAGDILLLKNVIDILNNQKNIKLYLLTKQEYKEIAEILSIKNFIGLNSKSPALNELNKILGVINNEKFDVIFDFQNNIKSRYLLLFSKAKKKYVLNKNIIKRRLMVIFKWFLGDTESVSDKYEKLIKKHFPDIRNKNITHKLKLKRKIKNIVIHIGAKWELKRWLYYFELINFLKQNKKLKLIITGKKEEVENYKELLYIKGRNIINKIGKTCLKDLYNIIKKADFFIGNDTAIAHMAAINSVPGIVFMGPTVKSFGFITEENFIVMEKDLGCRPCHLHGGNKCPIGTFDCMRGIKAKDVFNKINEIIN